MTQTPHQRPLSRVVAFLLAFLVLILVVSYRFLLPAYRVWHDVHQDDQARKGLAVISWLVLILVLFVLLAILVATFRPSRWLFPRRTSPRTRTRYVDAWAESAKRLDPPSEE